ncbi:hypothetical protein EYF80_039703 [Liparis tanakae]|uniref:Uncharacterized protein n=1 Tax=Liparis tanakae TaxID=230148 RepID=A0A4Z2G976_9TELE|nr:hypothetical protein EYF80_039703 [Liparis tanakae]
MPKHVSVSSDPLDSWTASRCAYRAKVPEWSLPAGPPSPSKMDWSSWAEHCVALGSPSCLWLPRLGMKAWTLKQ